VFGGVDATDAGSRQDGTVRAWYRSQGLTIERGKRRQQHAWERLLAQ
jgi:hypothetical protein